MKSSPLRHLNKLLYNRFLLYAVLIVSLINMTVYALMGDIITPVIFVLVGVITAYFNKNMLVVLFVSFVFSNISKLVKTSNSLKSLMVNGEGYENMEDTKDEPTEESEEPMDTENEAEEETETENYENKKKVEKHVKETYENLFSLQQKMEKSIESMTNDLSHAEKIIEKLENKFNN
jgi:hypothetical protein